MSRQLGEYLRGLLRRKSEIRQAIVESGPTLGLYSVRLRDTGGVINAVPAQPADVYAVGKQVIVRVGAAGRDLNERPVILGVSQASENGAIVDDLEVITELSGVSVVETPALPIFLTRGGAAACFTLHGDGLATATYPTADITDDVAQVTTGSSITLRPKASLTCTTGRYTLTVSGVVIDNFFEVI